MNEICITDLRAAAARLLYSDNRDTADYNLLIEFIDSAFREKKENRWIPVTERLPDKEFWEHQKRFEDEDLEVQVMIKGACRPTTLLYNAEGEFYEMHGDGATFYIVTHWAPLMEPPKEDVE